MSLFLTIGEAYNLLVGSGAKLVIGNEAVAGSGAVKRWDGSSWVVVSSVKYWNGSAWNEKSLKYWTGSTWE